MRPRELTALADGLVALALLLVPIEALAIAQAGTDVFRFSPIADLDVISAGLIPAVGAIAALSLRPTSARGHILQLAIVTVLVAAAVVPARAGRCSRSWPRPWRCVLIRPPRLAAAAGVAWRSGSSVGSAHRLEHRLASVTSTSTPCPSRSSQPGRPGESRPPISTLSVRRHWIEDAVRETPERPIFGHGVGMFEDNTPEARLMGVEGQRTVPAQHVRGGGVLVRLPRPARVRRLRGFSGGGARGGRRNRAESREPAVPFALALGVFALVNTNISGEIGSTPLLWSAVAIALALYTDLTRSATRRRARGAEAPTAK